MLSQQLAIMAQQLDMLKSGNAPAAPRAEAPPAPRVTAPAPAADTAAKPSSPAAHGPYRPIAKGPAAAVTTEQARHLTAFVDRYVRRTEGSKRLTARHRTHLADPRSVAGFRMSWKETVYPIVVERSAGSRLWDVDGNEYIDLVNGFGLNLFGHSPAFVTKAVAAPARARDGDRPPDAARRRSGGAACARWSGWSAPRSATPARRRSRPPSGSPARFTGRDKIAMFAGAYHGTFDEVLVRPTVVDGTLRSVPVAPGIAPNMADSMVVLEYGSPEALEAIAARASELAAVLVEPVQSRRPELQPREFLQELRRITAAAETSR